MTGDGDSSQSSSDQSSDDQTIKLKHYSSNDITWSFDGMSNDDRQYVLKAIAYYGILGPEAKSLWHSYQDVLSKDKSTEFDIEYCDSGYKVVMAQAGGTGTAVFQDDSARKQDDGTLIHGERVCYWTEDGFQPGEHTDASDRLIPIEEILNYVNKRGGKQLIDQYNFKTNIN